MLCRMGLDLRTFRISVGMSQEALAEVLQTTQPTISRIEAGRVSPRASLLLRMITWGNAIARRHRLKIEERLDFEALGGQRE